MNNIQGLRFATTPISISEAPLETCFMIGAVGGVTDALADNKVFPLKVTHKFRLYSFERTTIFSEVLTRNCISLNPSCLI